jgi:hypothetical protein
VSKNSDFCINFLTFFLVKGIGQYVPLVWGFVRTPHDIESMDMEMGYEETDEDSCRLAVTLGEGLNLMIIQSLRPRKVVGGIDADQFLR